MANLRTIVKILFLALLTSLPLHAGGEGNMIVTSLTANDGLANNTVWSVLQDKAGFIWIGTSDGLDRYDGKGIRHFLPDRNVGENNNVLSLCEDDFGKIWVGTYSGLCVVDPKTEEEKVFPLGLQDVDDASVRVYQIIKTDDKLWIPAGKYGFIRIDTLTGEVKRFNVSADGKTTYYAAALCFDGRDCFYMVMGDGNIYYSKDEFASVVPMFEEPVLSYHPTKLTYAFGYLFTGAAEENIKIDVCTGLVSRTPWSTVRVPLQSGNDELLAAGQSGFHILDSDLKDKMRITMDVGSSLAFQGKSIMCACKDRDGNYWVGTYYSGVFHLINNRANLRKYYPRFVGDAEPSHVREMAPDSDGTVWVATEDKGLLRFSPENGIFMPVKLPLTAFNIQALSNDGPYLWIGAFAQGYALARMDKRDGTVTVFEDSPQRIYSICPLRNGTVAIGASKGLYIMKDGTFVRSSMIRSVVQEVMEDTHGHLWVSTGKDGLWCCQGSPEDDSAKWIHYVHDPESRNSIPSNKVTSVFEDKESRIWVTTESGGFCRLNPQTGRFTRYVDFEHTDCKVCYKISEDINGILWITTSKGLLSFNPKTNVAALLTNKDGLLSNQYNYASNVISPDGTLYAGSGEGLISFEPEKILHWPRNSTIMLTDFQVVEPREGKRSGVNLSGSINTLSSIRLKNRHNSFKIGVATDNYCLPVINRLVYKLEGQDNEWMDVPGGVIEINKLKSGKYRLCICVKRINGDLEPGMRYLEIEVRKPLMASVPAVVLYIVLFVVLILMAKWISVREERKKNAQELLAAQMEFVTAMAHEIKTPLTLAQGSVELILNGNGNQKEELCKNNLEVAYKNMDRIRELVSQLQDFSSVQSCSHTPQMSHINLVEDINRIFSRFSVDADIKGVQFSINVPDRPIYVWTERDALDKIVTNMFSNAVKYAGSKASVELLVGEDVFRVVVINDGIIIPREMSKQIFDPFVRCPENSGTAPGMGIGLSTSRKLARMLGGEIIYGLTEDGLNCFTLKIPVYKHVESAPIPEYDDQKRMVSVKKEQEEAKTLLIVEDTMEMKDFISAQLSAEYTILQANNGEHALEILQDGAMISLILSDVMMPGMDGFELCRRIKGNIMTSHIPVILLTAKTDTGSKIEGLGCGVDMYLEKPFSLDHLRAAIRNVVENRDQLRKHYLLHPLDSDSVPSGSTAYSDFIKRFVSFVEDNIDNESLRIADLAQATCVSESNLYKKTKALLEMTPLEYVQVIRMKVAVSLLKDSKLPISEIVIRTGFHSHPYFSACFKKQYGITPGQYRRTMSEKQDIDKLK